jgi:hypothetical protein
VFWAVHMFEAAVNLLLFGVVHIECDVVHLYLGE